MVGRLASAVGAFNSCLAALPATLYPLQGFFGLFLRLPLRRDKIPLAAPLAQSVERFHGKEKVNGSIPLGGSVDAGRRASHEAM